MQSGGSQPKCSFSCAYARGLGEAATPLAPGTPVCCYNRSWARDCPRIQSAPFRPASRRVYSQTTPKSMYNMQSVAPLRASSVGKQHPTEKLQQVRGNGAHTFATTSAARQPRRKGPQSEQIQHKRDRTTQRASSPRCDLQKRRAFHCDGGFLSLCAGGGRESGTYG